MLTVCGPRTHRPRIRSGEAVVRLALDYRARTRPQGGNVDRAGLQAALRAIGVVAVVAGARGMLLGAREAGDGAAAASVDSEYRFYAAWYHVMGYLLLRAARSPEVEPAVVRACAGGFFAAACARLLSRRSLGPPRRSQTLLTAAELALAAGLPLWRARAAAAVDR
jgi:hypothetical protein